MIRSTLMALTFAAGLPVAAAAQDAAPLCHHAGLTYSPGGMIRVGSVLQRCGISDNVPQWVTVDEAADPTVSANCVSGGREFSQGTILVVGAKELKCSKGVWYPS